MLLAYHRAAVSRLIHFAWLSQADAVLLYVTAAFCLDSHAMKRLHISHSFIEQCLFELLNDKDVTCSAGVHAKKRFVFTVRPLRFSCKWFIPCTNGAAVFIITQNLLSEGRQCWSLNNHTAHYTEEKLCHRFSRLPAGKSFCWGKSLYAFWHSFYSTTEQLLI